MLSHVLRKLGKCIFYCVGLMGDGLSNCRLVADFLLPSYSWFAVPMYYCVNIPMRGGGSKVIWQHGRDFHY